MLMEHLLCDDVGGKRNVCGMNIEVNNFQLFIYCQKNNSYEINYI
jgi:hypothetical protein